MNRIFLLALLAFFFCPIVVKSDERIYETKNICGRYYAAEINGEETAQLLGLKKIR